MTFVVALIVFSLVQIYFKFHFGAYFFKRSQIVSERFLALLVVMKYLNFLNFTRFLISSRFVALTTSLVISRET